MRAAREPSLVDPVGADRPDPAVADECEPPSVRPPRRLVRLRDEARPMAPVGIGDPQVAARDVGDALRIRAPGGRVPDRHRRGVGRHGYRRGRTERHELHASSPPTPRATGPARRTCPRARGGRATPRIVRGRKSASSSGSSGRRRVRRSPGGRSARRGAARTWARALRPSGSGRPPSRRSGSTRTPPVSRRGDGSPASRWATNRCDPCVIETRACAPRPVRARSSERGEHLDHGALRAGGEVGDLDRRQRGRGVGERAGVAEVVQVVAGLRRVRARRRRSR